MQHSVIQIGNSIGVIIPKDLRNGLEAGDKVLIEGKKEKLMITAVKKKKSGGVDAKFMKMVDEFMIEHDDVLRELAER